MLDKNGKEIKAGDFVKVSHGKANRYNNWRRVKNGFYFIPEVEEDGTGMKAIRVNGREGVLIKEEGFRKFKEEYIYSSSLEEFGADMEIRKDVNPEPAILEVEGWLQDAQDTVRRRAIDEKEELNAIMKKKEDWKIFKRISGILTDDCESLEERMKGIERADWETASYFLDCYEFHLYFDDRDNVPLEEGRISGYEAILAELKSQNC